MKRRHVVTEVTVKLNDTFSRAHEHELDFKHGLSLNIRRAMVTKRERSLPDILDGVSPGKKRCNGRLELGLDLVCRLPEHILCFIFSRLLLDHPLFLYQCTRVCKLWNKLIKNEVDLKGMWAKQEPWLLVRRGSKSAKYEMWCLDSGVRFPVPAELIPEAISRQDELGLVRVVGTHQGLALIQSELGYFVWAPLSGASLFIPYPITPPPPALHRRFASDIWADAEQAVFKIGHHSPDGLHLYDSSAGEWVFEETPSEIRELGKMPGDSILKSLNLNCAFPAPMMFLRQYASDCKQGLFTWKEWDKTPRRVGVWFALFRDGQGRCNGVSLSMDPMPSFTAMIWRLDDDLGEWKFLAEQCIYSEVALCIPEAFPDFCIACSENRLMLGMGGRDTPYPARILVLNLDTLMWDSLYSDINQEDDSIHVMAIFKPTLPPHFSKFKV